MLKRLSAVLAAAALAAVLLIPSTASAYGEWCRNLGSIAYLGASSEVGWGTTGYDGDRYASLYHPTRYGWVARVSRFMRNDWGVEMVNPSRGGAMASDYLPGGRFEITRQAINEVDQADSGLAVISLGGNEFYIQKHPDQFKADLVEMMNRLRAAVPDVYIVFVIYPEFQATHMGQPIVHPWHEYGQRIYETALQNTSGALIDLRQSIDPAHLDGAGLWAPDGIHLNDAGQSVQASVAHSWINARC